MSGIITILGGKITATAGTGGDGFACDIGAAAEWTPGGDITINGGVIQANLIGSAQNTYSLTMNGNAIVYTGNHGIDAILNITNGILFNNSIGNVYGDVLTDYDFNIPSGYTLNIPTGKSITIQSGKSLTNEGTVIVNGTLTSDGSITNDGTVVVNDGSTVTVNGAAVSGANKILGANVNQPVLVSRTHESITMGANSTTLKATTGQGAEFGISIVNNVATATWGNMTGIFTESSSGVALLPNTSYYFFVRSAANENFNYGTASNSIVFRTLPLLTGSVYISGDIIYGSQLTASPNNLPGSAVAVYYKWHREGVIESISTEATYTLVAADVGKKIKVVITSQNPNFGGSLEDEVGPIQPRPITFTGTVSASKVYDGNDIFTDTHIIINNITSFANILPADEGAGKVELSKTGASGKFGPAPGTGVLSNVSGFTLTGERAHNYTLSAQPSPVPAEILSLPEAIDDRVSVFACHSKTVNVLANDYNVGGGNLTIDRNGKRGDAQVSGTDVIYNHNAAGCATHGGKHDTVKYSICTANGCDTAKLIVDILRLPSIKLMDSCSRSPYLTIDYQYPNAQHQWYRSPTGGDGTWTEMDSSLRLKVPVTEDAWYKVEITHAGETVVDKVHFVVHRKSKLQGNTFWYISSIIR